MPSPSSANGTRERAWARGRKKSTMEPVTTSASGYASPITFAGTLPAAPLYAVPKAVAQLTKRSAHAVIVPSKRVRTCDTLATESEEIRTTPAMANGTSSKNPASAKDGNGTSCRRMISYHHQMTLPMPHEKLEAPRSTHPLRRRPCRRAAVLQQSVAAATGTRMEMLSSASLATWRPPHWRPIQSTAPTAISAAAAEATANECRRAARSKGFITASSSATSRLLRHCEIARPVHDRHEAVTTVATNLMKSTPTGMSSQRQTPVSPTWITVEGQARSLGEVG